jgi:protein TonB
MTDTTHPDQHATPMQDDAPRKGATPLLWILLAVAIVAFAWWYSANRNAASVVGYDTTPIGSAQTATEAESTAVATRPGRAATAQRPGRATPATRTPAIQGAQLLAHAKPRYPAEEQRRGVQGSVTLRIAIDANGVPTDVGYASRSGNNALDRAALVAARDWRFKPAVRNGQAVASTVNVPVDFKL